MREIVVALKLADAPIDALIDLGCGTGAASAAWALALDRAPLVTGVDLNAWALGEARWNWRELGVAGRTRRGDLVSAARLQDPGRRPRLRTAVLLAWSLNELAPPPRDGVVAALKDRLLHGDALLVVEPLARSAAPWWEMVASDLAPLGVRTDEWKFDTPLPARLADLNDAAGFGERQLSARTLSRV
jgi:hypothetical protein